VQPNDLLSINEKKTAEYYLFLEIIGIKDFLNKKIKSSFKSKSI